MALNNISTMFSLLAVKKLFFAPPAGFLDPSGICIRPQGLLARIKENDVRSDAQTFVYSIQLVCLNFPLRAFRLARIRREGDP